MVIETRLQQIIKNKMPSTFKLENEIDQLEKEIKSIKREVDYLNIHKISIEQKLVEQNFLAPNDDLVHTSSVALQMDRFDSNQSFHDEIGQLWQLQNIQAYNRTNPQDNPYPEINSQKLNSKLMQTENAKSNFFPKENNRNLNHPLQMLSSKLKSSSLKSSSFKPAEKLLKNKDEPGMSYSQNYVKKNSLSGFGQQSPMNNTLSRARSVPKALTLNLNNNISQVFLSVPSPRIQPHKENYQKMPESKKRETTKNTNFNNALGENINYNNIQNMQAIFTPQVAYNMPLQNKQSASRTHKFTENIRVLSPFNEEYKGEMQEKYNQNQYSDGNKSKNTNKKFGSTLSEEDNNINNHFLPSKESYQNYPISKLSQNSSQNLRKSFETTKRNNNRCFSLENSMKQDGNNSLITEQRHTDTLNSKDSGSNPFFRNYAVFNDTQKSSTRIALQDPSTPDTREIRQLDKQISCSNNERSHSVGSNAARVLHDELRDQHYPRPFMPTYQSPNNFNGTRISSIASMPGHLGHTMSYGNVINQQSNNQSTPGNIQKGGFPINCKQCKEKGECITHKKIFKFNMENCTLSEISFFEAVIILFTHLFINF